MSLISNTLMAFSMSADAFAASIGKGTTLRKPRLSQAARMALVFGCVEAITPIIGWALGMMARPIIESIDHWIAFTFLGLIGTRMIYHAFCPATEEKQDSLRFSVLILTAIGTSIDAMALGATLAFLDVNIWIMAAAIGAATFLMATLGIMTGQYIGKKAGKMAEALGGCCLIGIGSTILLQHLGIW